MVDQPSQAGRSRRQLLTAGLFTLFLACSWPARAQPLGFPLPSHGASLRQTGAPRPSQKTEVWLGGRDPLRKRLPDEPPSDFLQMFTPNAPWERTAAGVRVMQLPPAFVLRTDKATLARIFRDLDRRHIALGVQFGWLHGEPGTTGGKGIEGFSHPGSAALMARIVKAAGGDLRYVAMDEPLEFGHNYSGPNACHYSIAQTAQVVAEGVAEVRAVFPDVQIGDTEPVGSQDPTWPGQIRQWLAAYQSATHTPLAFLHADIQWNQPWLQQVPPVKQAAHQAHIPFGIIYDGVGSSDRAWTDGAAMRFQQIEATPRLRPDQAIFESWEIYPTECLPETQLGTLTNLALRFIQQY